jgi:hypothetical protein
MDLVIPISDVRGFNYAGSWGTSGLDLWQHHDNGTMAVEIARGKGYFPGWTVVRWWLSYEAFQRNPDRFLANFEAGLAIFARHELQAIPVLFNRWRDPLCDFGGVSLEHIIPGFGPYCTEADFASLEATDANPWSIQTIFGEYLRRVVGGHATDPRILTWDICNEPFFGPYLTDGTSLIRQGELRWLSWCRDACKEAGAVQPLTIGNLAHLEAIRLTEPLTEIISFHPYFRPASNDKIGDLAISATAEFEAHLDDVVEFAAHCDKPVLASETVWGAVADEDHVALMRYTLEQLVKRNIGFAVHALHHSLVADLHSAAHGPVGLPERLEFINADGTLRRGHEAFNEFARA